MEEMEELITEVNPTDNILDKIEFPGDLRALPVEDLPRVCQALRQRIIGTLASHPGHFASSMGAVELTVALHYVFDTPLDKIVWDVGHQAYAHKLLTGRAKEFHTLRQENGLSGFPNPKESEYDTFMAGHASNSISAALGMAVADSLGCGEEKSRTVAVIGDASISGGLAFEGLNNASQRDNNLLIVLNDNDMSIDPNVGAMHKYLSRLTTSSGYNRMRFRAYNFLKRRGVIGQKGRGLVLRFTNAIKSLVSKRQNIFEGLNIRYFGPIDGHDVLGLVKVLRELRDMTGPRLLHICTQKGRGYAPAEEMPSIWHAPGKFNPLTGQRIKGSGAQPKWQDIFGETLVELAARHPEVVGITAAMPSGTGLNKLMAAFPDRAFDVGISEGHAVTFAGGLAASGKRPFVAIYSSFLQRAYDNIIHDVAMQGLPVTFCIDRAGVVGDDGMTHHGLFDLAYLSVIPGMKIASPMDAKSLRDLMYLSLTQDSPLAIRYPRGSVPAIQEEDGGVKLEMGKGRLIHDSESPVAILTIGPAGIDALKAVSLLKEEGLDAAVYDMVWLSPIDEVLLKAIASKHKNIITVEDASVHGGFGTAVTEWISANAPDVSVKKLGAPAQTWVKHASVERQKEVWGYNADAIVNAVKAVNSKSSNNTRVS